MDSPTVLSAGARQKVIELVLAGKLSPGERIKEVHLSRALKISRTPLREALISLERIGLVESEPNVGFSVKCLSIEEVEELYPLLWVLEGYALCLAFPLLRTQINELTACNEELYAKRKSPRDVSLADRKFHRLLTQLSRNRTLLAMIDDLRLRVSCYEHRYMADSKLLETSFEQHQAIIAAIKRGDQAAAQEALTENWRFGMQVLIAKLTREAAV